MTAATANREAKGVTYTDQPALALPLKSSEHVYRGTLGVLDLSSGEVVNFASYDSNYRFAGVHLLERHNNSDADYQIDDDEAVLAQSGTALMVYGDGDADDGDLLKPVYATDNQTVQTSSSSAIYVGRIVKVISTTSVIVEIDTSQAANV